LARSVCHFIDKTFFEKGLVRMANRAPKTHWQGQVHRHMRNACVWPFIGLIESTLGGGFIQDLHLAGQTIAP
jgi:hypothetical protein